MERLFVPEISIGYFQITDLTTAGGVGLATAWAAAFPNNGITAGQYILVIDAEGGNVRWRSDAGAPTVAVGSRLIQDTSMIFTANNPSGLRFLQEVGAAGAVKLNVSVFQQKV
jgi:hypothetical protein